MMRKFILLMFILFVLPTIRANAITAPDIEAG